MSLATRILPREEYGRLEGTELADVPVPDGASVVVVEDEDAIVGCWMLVTVCHAEGVWIAPAYRRKGGVALRLLRGMRTLAKAHGASQVCTSSLDGSVTRLIERLHGQRLPGEHFLFPVGA
jgi:hypothetical protein